jgi:hypothetical protein
LLFRALDQKEVIMARPPSAPIACGDRGRPASLVTAELTPSEKRFRTQWATTFLAAAELVRRGYIVSFTTGNHTPIADLMVGTKSGDQFWVDVKGLANKADWLMRPKEPFNNLFYVLIYLSPLVDHGKQRQPDQYYVLTQSEANGLERAYREARPNKKITIPGFRFQSAEPYGTIGPNCRRPID